MGLYLETDNGKALQAPDCPARWIFFLSNLGIRWSEIVTTQKYLHPRAPWSTPLFIFTGGIFSSGMDTFRSVCLPGPTV